MNQKLNLDENDKNSLNDLEPLIIKKDSIATPKENEVEKPISPKEEKSEKEEAHNDENTNNLNTQKSEEKSDGKPEDKSPEKELLE